MYSCVISDILLNNAGTEFIFTFLDSPPNTAIIELQITTFTTAPVSVDVIYRLANGNEVTENHVVTGGSTTIVLPASLRTSGTGFANTVIVRANTQIQVATTDRGSCAASLIIPVAYLGTEYLTLSWQPQSQSQGASQIHITSSSDANVVSIKFHRSSPINFMYNGASYTAGSTLTITMQKYDTFRVVDHNDLSGTHVTSQQPVTVNSGNAKVMIDQGLVDSVIYSVPGVNTWGSEFLVVLPADITYPTNLKFITNLPQTTVTVYAANGISRSVTVATGGDYDTFNIASANYLRVISNNPISLVHFYPGSPGSNSHLPAAMQIPPTVHYKSDYDFNTPQGTSTHTLMLAVEQQQAAQLLLDGTVLNSISWSTIPNMSPVTVVGTIVVGDGTHNIRHTGGIRFAAFLYGK